MASVRHAPQCYYLQVLERLRLLIKGRLVSRPLHQPLVRCYRESKTNEVEKQGYKPRVSRKRKPKGPQKNKSKEDTHSDDARKVGSLPWENVR
jgi:hypothetical protein